MSRHPNPISGWLKKLSDSAKKQANQVSKGFDKIIYNKRASFIASGIFAVVFCLSISFNDLRFQLLGKDVSTLNLTNVPVTQLLDSESYEVTGMPATADVSIQGDESDIQMVRIQNAVSVRADLRTLAEGENTVSLEVVGVPSGMTSSVNPSTVQVVLAKKETRTFFISEQATWMVGTGQSESDFSIGALSTKSVSIKATQKNLNAIRSVKAIIDTSGHASNFSTEAALIAYDAEGKPVNCSINPKTVTVDVKYKGKTDASTAK
ncbi:MAG: hypothetical protein HUJ55_04825 [Ileibacterium sp.]|nr:hypothetical protein [Ileibacterium sp.]